MKSKQRENIMSLELSINENILLEHDYEVMSRLRDIVDSTPEDDILVDGLIQLVEENTTESELVKLSMFVAVELLLKHIENN